MAKPPHAEGWISTREDDAIAKAPLSMEGKEPLLRVGADSYSANNPGGISPRKRPRIVLGIDPGSTIMGYAVVVVDPAVRNVAPSFVVAGAIMLSQYRDHYQRLGAIHARVSQLIKSYQPTEMAIEAPFFGKNAQSMLKLGRAQGVAIAAGIGHGLPIAEYAPRKVKIAVTGSGGASKQQVANMLYRIFPNQGLEQLRFQDATDGLAVALCHAYSIPLRIASRSNAPTVGKTLPSRAQPNPLQVAKAQLKAKRSSSWSDFIKCNPSRIKKGNTTNE